MKAKDLVPYLGTASKVSEVLSGRRRLSLAMIRNLTRLGIPAQVLLQDTTPAKKPRTTAKRRTVKHRVLA